MRYAVISDIHANLEALQATLRDISGQDVQEVICLGDMVGYYPNPNECVDLCRKHRIRCLRGNHDDAAAGICGTEDFNPVAQNALEWTIRELQEAKREWLRRLPEQLQEDHFLAVHGSPWHPYAYILNTCDAQKAFSHLSTHYEGISICFFGHTHQRAAFSFRNDEVMYIECQDGFTLQEGGCYLINPGSVGQARDGRPGASYLIFDTDSKQVEYRRVPYQLELTMQKVFEAALPQILAERLVLGY